MISESFCVVGRLSPQSRGAFLNGVSEQVQSPGGLRRDTFTSLLLAAFALLVASLFAAAALTGPLAWAVGLIYICYDTWLLSTMVRTSRRAILEQLRAGPDKAGQLPTMAVLITARNEQGALPLALDAVLSQADQPEQLIVIDDGSTHYNTPRNLEGSFFAQGSWQVTGPLVLSAGYEQLHQFGQVDHRLNLAAYFNPVDSLQLGARIAVSPSANTIANWDAALSAEQKIASFVSALVTLRHLDFSDNGVTILGPGLRLSYAPLSLLLSGGPVFSTVFSTQAFGQGRLEWTATGALTLYGGYSRGGEAQHVAGSALLPPGSPATEIRTSSSIVGGALWQLDRSFGLRLDFTHEDREAAYARNSYGSAMTLRL